jgi:excisionase family DNA binding protein
MPDGLIPISITIKRAVELSGFPRSRIYTLLKEGKITSTKEGRQRVVHYDSLEAYIKRSA